VKIIAAVSIVIILLVIGIILFFKSGKWEKTSGVIKKMEMREEYTSPNSDIAKHENLFRYRVDIEYDYQYQGKRYTGSKIYPLIPNVFESEKLARKTVDSLIEGSKVMVYFDPSAPGNSALITSEGIGIKSILIIVFTVLLVALFIVGGVYLFKLF
jgi:hypothetical protein